MNNHFFDNKTFRFDVYLLFNKFNSIIFIAFKMFLNDLKYNDNKYIRFRIDCDIKFDNYQIKVFRLFKDII